MTTQTHTQLIQEEHEYIAALLSEAADNLFRVANELEVVYDDPAQDPNELGEDLWLPVAALRRRLREMYAQQFPTATDNNPYVDEDGI